MTPPIYTLLKDRRVVKISGEDSADFLQNLLLTDISQLKEHFIYPTALLTPQGKILFDGLIFLYEGAFYLDIFQPILADFLKKLTLYRLRAKLAIESLEGCQIFVGNHKDTNQDSCVLCLEDTRFKGDNAIWRFYKWGKNFIPSFYHSAPQNQEFWPALRFSHGLVECSKDYPPNCFYPYDLNYDKLGALYFHKGCYLGQEVISRIYHRQAIKKRLFMLEMKDKAFPFQETQDILVDNKKVGQILAYKAKQALAVLKLDSLPQNKRLTFNHCDTLIKDCENMDLLISI